MKPLVLSFLWIFIVSGLLISGISFWYLSSIAPQVMAADLPDETASERTTIFAANEDDLSDVKGVETVLGAQDGRAEIVARFLERHNSPLQPYDHFGQVFVDIADRYGFDFRLLPSIAMQESNLCKVIPDGSYNCLGFGIHERGTLKFESFEANFERAGRELKKYYIDEGRTTPQDIMKKYTPSSDGSWANSVNQWMAEMRYDDRQLGRERKTNGSVLEFAKE